jgi:thiamine pyrophosphate-dependent acetolactate synthase large subunit-like protein
MQVGEAMVAQMARWGIKDLFGLSGSSILPLLDALRRQGTIHYWRVRRLHGIRLREADGTARGKVSSSWFEALPIFRSNT